jgi:hypothetical protein
MSTHLGSDTSWLCVACRGRTGRGQSMESGSTSDCRIPERIFPYLCWIKLNMGSSPGRYRLLRGRSASTSWRTTLLWTLHSEMNLIWKCCLVSQSAEWLRPKIQSMLISGKLCMICGLHCYLLALHNTLRCSELSRTWKSIRQARQRTPKHSHWIPHLC